MQFLNGPFEHRYLAARDEMDEDIGPAIAEFIEVVEAARGSTAEPKILVHCEVGVSRSASLAIACLMDDNDISMFDAFDQVRSKRAQVLPNIGFASALQEFEFTMHPERRAAKTSLARYLKEACSVPAQIDEIEDALRQNDFDAPSALRAIYGEIPRVVQGTRTR